jgi:bla regulator protein blaR1
MARCLRSPRSFPVATAVLSAALFAAPAAPARAATGGSGERHSSSHSNQDAYVLTFGKSTITTNLDLDSYAQMRERHAGDFLWFRRHGSGYLIDDPETLRAAQDLFASVHALEPEQRDLGRRQEALSEQEDALEREQDALDSQIDRLTDEGGETEGDWDDEFSAQDEMDAAPATDEDRAEIDRELEQLRTQQDALRPRQHELESKSRELDSEERALDAREDKLEREAEAKLWALIDAAIRSGAAKPSPSP